MSINDDGLPVFNEQEVADISPVEMDSVEIRTLNLMIKLQNRKESLQIKLNEKCEELKRLCMSEFELTGILPMETPINPGESPPRARRRVGTMYPYDEKTMKQLAKLAESPKRKKNGKPILKSPTSRSLTSPVKKSASTRSHPYKSLKFNFFKKL